MVTWYKRIRLAAYTFGISGLLAVLGGKYSAGTRAEQLQALGMGGVLICFILLFVSYALFTAIRMSRKR